LEIPELAGPRTTAALIGKTRKIVKKDGGRAILKHDTNGDSSAIHKLGREQMLPNDLYAKWDGNDQQGIGLEARIVEQSLRELKV
jgi:hypothetical protein